MRNSLISLFIDFLCYKKSKPTKERKIIKLQGIWKGYEIDVENELNELRKQTWKHVDEPWSCCTSILPPCENGCGN